MPSAQVDGGGGALLERIGAAIRRDGPMPVDRYMQMCLGDPELGYWQRAASIGARGREPTAPRSPRAGPS